MKARRIGRLLMCAASAAVFASALSFATAGASTRAAADQSWIDPTGDARGAPDLTTVRITHTAAGQITVSVTAVGYSTIGAESGPMVKVYLDTDKNPATGSLAQDGAEYYLAAERSAQGSGWWVARWDGSKYVDAAQTPSMLFVRSGDTMMWGIDKSDIGVTDGFTFYVWSSTWDANDNLVAEDTAPDEGAWSYELSAPAPAPMPKPVVKPLIGQPRLVPATVHAGRRLTVTFPVTRSDTGKALASGTMICDPSVAGKVIQHAESFAGGRARLSFVVPKAAKGKALRVKVTIKTGTRSATRIATFRIG